MLQGASIKFDKTIFLRKIFTDISAIMYNIDIMLIFILEKK